MLVSAGWVILLAAIGRHRIFVSNDTLSNDVHVWWIADGLRHGHGLRLHMPVLGHGHALTYPYAFVPWTLTALAWLVIGEHAVTFALVAGCALLLVATLWAFPELTENRWLGAVALANPVLVAVAVLGQLPFAWAAAALFLAFGLWRRGRIVAATLTAALAMATHPAVIIPILGGVVVVMLVHRWDRRLALAFLCATVLALPAIWMVVASPVFSDASTGTKVVEFAATVGARSAVVLSPLFLVWVGRRAAQWAPALLLLALVLNIALVAPLDTRSGWRGLRRQPDGRVLSFVTSPAFVPGATYRLLGPADAKVGMYRVVEHGGRLDSELFPESMARHSFPDAARYGQFLRSRRVDIVLAYPSFDRMYRTNEHVLLEQLSTSDSCRVAGVSVTRFQHDPTFDAYRIGSCA